MDQISSIEKGNSSDDVKKMLVKKHKSNFKISENSEEYDVLIYDMQTGTEQRMGTNMNPTTGVPTTFWYDVPVSEPYAFIFKNNKLLFWGFLNECGKEDNDTIVNLGIKINEHLNSKKHRGKSL
jgi:hypothetical protein